MLKHTPSFTTHLEQYIFACNYCYKKKVLDIGCGDGYGPHILSYGANHLDVVDKNTKVLARAKRLYRNFADTNYHAMDLETEFPEGKWDVIVALQILEHLENVEDCVKYTRQALNKDGILIFGIPHMLSAEDHKRLYKAKDVLNLFKDFNDIDLYIHDGKVISREPNYKGVKSYVGIAYK